MSKEIIITIPSIEECSFELEVSVDCMPIKGNAMASGDEKFDVQVESEIEERLESGDVWAWAFVRVTCKHDDLPGIEGVDGLGGCTYHSRKDFVENSGYFEDMKQEAYGQFVEVLEAYGQFVEVLEAYGQFVEVLEALGD